MPQLDQLSPQLQQVAKIIGVDLLDAKMKHQHITGLPNIGTLDYRYQEVRGAILSSEDIQADLDDAQRRGEHDQARLFSDILDRMGQMDNPEEMLLGIIKPESVIISTINSNHLQ